MDMSVFSLRDERCGTAHSSDAPPSHVAQQRQRKACSCVALLKSRPSIDSLWLYTMNRCHTQPVRFALAAFLAVPLAFAIAVAALAPSASLAQESIRRDAPKDVTLAKMTVELPPVIRIDGKVDRLSPGSRIRDTRNMLVLSAGLSGQTLPVVYKRDAAGLVHEVWLLTADEYKQLSGVSGSGNEAVQQFLDLLSVIFGARR
jgi:hypothetical protein